MVHVTDLGFTPQELERAITEGQVTARRHPTLPLAIYAYSDEVHFAQHWTPVTTNCRGLILDLHYNVVARPWKKFYNLGDKNAEFPWDAPAEVTDKMDGSLGILWTYGDQFGIATKGSFTSEQAEHADDIFYHNYAGNVIFSAAEQYTFLFEIVVPWNRIVVHYGDTDDLFLLGAVHTERGYYLGPNEAAAILGWTGPVTKVMPARSVSEAIAAADRRNAEGVVIRSGNKMVKLKQSDYVELHKIISNLSEKTIWEQMVEGKNLTQIVAPLPDEWHQWARKVYDDMALTLIRKLDDIVNEYYLITPGLDRKTFAGVVSSSPNRGLLFKLYDGKDIRQDVLKSLKPKGASSAES